MKIYKVCFMVHASDDRKEYLFDTLEKAEKCVRDLKSALYLLKLYAFYQEPDIVTLDVN